MTRFRSRVKGVRDASVGLGQHRGLSLHRPLTRQGPLIEPQPLGAAYDDACPGQPHRGRNVLDARVADIGFRRPEAAPISSNYRTLSIDRDQFMIEAADVCLGQQVLQHLSDCS